MVLPRFELAIRRTLFYLIAIFLYLLLGGFLFTALPSSVQSKLPSDKQDRLDFERAELLNILWAESLARTEPEWSLLANQKLDSYERSLAAAQEADERPQPIESFSDAFHHSFLLISTIGGIDTDDLSTHAKLFSIVYSFIGIPLMLLFLGQSVKAISSLLSSAQLFLFAAGSLFLGAVLYDVVEQTPDDTPFYEAIFSVFLAATTIGEEDGRVPRLLLYLIAVFSFGGMHACFYTIQRDIERRLQNLELGFSNQIADFLRFLGMEEKKHDDRIPEEDEEAIENEDDDDDDE